MDIEKIVNDSVNKMVNSINKEKIPQEALIYSPFLPKGDKKSKLEIEVFPNGNTVISFSGNKKSLKESLYSIVCNLGLEESLTSIATHIFMEEAGLIKTSTYKVNPQNDEELDVMKQMLNKSPSEMKEILKQMNKQDK